jgi:hypothetical protein
MLDKVDASSGAMSLIKKICSDFFKAEIWLFYLLYQKMAPLISHQYGQILKTIWSW